MYGNECNPSNFLRLEAFVIGYLFDMNDETPDYFLYLPKIFRQMENTR